MSAPPPLLVVEDDLILRTTLQTVLSHAGYQVVAASNGQQAINQLHTQPFADPFGVIVSDIELGDLDGLQVLSTARALPQPPEVILITGHSTIASAVQALRFGAFDYLTKPVAMSELLPTSRGRSNAMPANNGVSRRSTRFPVASNCSNNLLKQCRMCLHLPDLSATSSWICCRLTPSRTTLPIGASSSI